MISAPAGVTRQVRAAALAALALLCVRAPARGAQERPGALPRSAPQDERSATAVAGPRVPNVLVLLGDDFNWTDLESVATPNLDGLAARGMTFRRTYAFPVCSPTRYALLFGRYPRRDGIGDIVSIDPPSADNPTPPLDLISLAENVRFTGRAFYHTAIFGKWHLGTNEYFDDRAPDYGPFNFGALTPMWQGFERWFGSMGNLADYSSWLSADDGIFVPSREYAPRAVLREFLEWWGTAAGPRFAYLAFHDAHAAYHDPPPDLLPPGYPTPSTNRERFEAMIASLDFMVGRMLETVDLQDTYVFFLTDNGTPLGVSIEDCPPRPWEPFNPFDCAKHTVFEPGIRVPMIVAGPDVPAGTESSALVSAADLMATVCELVGAEPQGEDSISFRATLLDPSITPRRTVFSEIFGEFPLFIGGDAFKSEAAAIGPRYKLRTIGGVESLYDLQSDPREAVRLDLADPALAGVLAELRAVLADPLDRDLQRY